MMSRVLSFIHELWKQHALLLQFFLKSGLKGQSNSFPAKTLICAIFLTIGHIVEVDAVYFG